MRDLGLVLEDGEDEHAALRGVREDVREDLQTAFARQADIEEQDVRMT